MTFTEVVEILRQFNERCKGCQFEDQYRVMEGIDAAIEMIERLEQIEAAAQNLVKMKGRHNTEIAYQRLVDALEKSK